MGRVISCCNAKGGTGKTTVALNLSAILSSHFRKKVLALDLDPQGNLAVGMGIDPRGFKKTSFRLMMDDAPDIDEYIINVRQKLDLIPNSLESSMESLLSSRRNRERLLESRLQAVKDSYDFIILDTPPALETSTINAMVASDEILIVIDCGYYALYGLNQLMETLSDVQREFQKYDLVIRALVNLFDQRQRMDREVLEEVERFFESLMLGTTIHKNIKLAEAASAGKPIIDYDKKSSGYFDFTRLAKELLDIYGRSRKGKEEGSASRIR
ncbi:MAG TPA: ParA family protein [Blastocatellia bacterium]|nr:ParA family protein [Blastocatellia bacterium]